AEQLHHLNAWENPSSCQRWVVVDGGYSKKPFVRPARQLGWVVVGRLRRDAALFCLPTAKREGQPGPAPIYGKERVSLAKRAGQKRGWSEVQCQQYGQQQVKTIKTFLATWKPAGGVIRVVLVQEDDNWLPYFCTDPQASAEEILEAVADRTAI